jgi:hypothetical protein
MGFRKPLYDVEEKGLDPKKPHRSLGSDGRLLVDPTPTSVDESEEQLLEETETPEDQEDTQSPRRNALKLMGDDGPLPPAHTTEETTGEELAAAEEEKQTQEKKPATTPTSSGRVIPKNKKKKKSQKTPSAPESRSKKT